MSHTWFECKIRYEKVAENGMNKKVTEPYLVDALSFNNLYDNDLEFRQKQTKLFNIVLEHDECAAHRYFRQ